MILDKKQLKLNIKAEIKKTAQDIVELKKQTSPISPENSIGRISRMDAINNKSINEASLRQSESKLTQLEEALLKVDHKDFGLCSRCKKPIPVGRILLMPHSTTCVNCA